jgi:putative transposase
MDKERYRRGPHTVTELKYHFVWKTKYSYPVLQGEIGLRLRELLREICVEKGLTVIKGNIRPNHLHVLVSAPAYYSPAKIAQYLKGKSSYRLQREFRALQKKYWGQHLWGRGYFCATVGAVTEEQVKRYIESQDDALGDIQIWDESKGGEGELQSD